MSVLHSQCKLKSLMAVSTHHQLQPAWFWVCPEYLM
jgi:hypothetical protein